jgi:hypothetical protein
MATRLKKLKVNRVDLVDRGANPGAHVLLWKRDDTPEEGTQMGKEDTVEISAEEGTTLIEAMSERIDSLEAELADARKSLAKTLSDPARPNPTDVQDVRKRAAVLRREIEQEVEALAKTRRISSAQAWADFLDTPDGAAFYAEFTSLAKQWDGPGHLPLSDAEQAKIDTATAAPEPRVTAEQARASLDPETLAHVEKAAGVRS